MSMRFGDLSIPMNNALCEPHSMTINSLQAAAFSAFTLIELLVSMAILAVLSAMLLPAFAKAEDVLLALCGPAHDEEKDAKDEEPGQRVPAPDCLHLPSLALLLLPSGAILQAGDFPVSQGDGRGLSHSEHPTGSCQISLVT